MDESEEERDWIRKSQLGDPAAFEALIRRYQRMVDALTFRMTGSLSEAEDLAQETFLRAFQHIGNFQASSKFSSRAVVNEPQDQVKTTDHDCTRRFRLVTLSVMASARSPASTTN